MRRRPRGSTWHRMRERYPVIEGSGVPAVAVQRIFELLEGGEVEDSGIPPPEIRPNAPPSRRVSTTWDGRSRSRPHSATRTEGQTPWTHHDYGGLHEDLKLTGVAMKRRDLLRLATGGVGMGALYLFGRADDLQGNAGVAQTCDKIPEETAGPFPGDGSNGPNVLDKAGVVRSDIRPSFAGLSGVAAGVPLTVTLQLVDLQNGCKPAPGLAVYVWHCDRAGRYSLYNRGATEQNYLRGVQESDSNGELSFTTIFPGCYRGRWPHIHFEVFPSLAAAAGRAEEDRDLAARVSGSRLRRGLRGGGIRGERAHQAARVAHQGQRLQGRGCAADGHDGRGRGVGAYGKADSGGVGSGRLVNCGLHFVTCS